MQNKPYPPNVRTVLEITEYIEMIFKHPDYRVTSFKIETVTSDGYALKLRWDHEGGGEEPVLIPK